MAQSQIQEQRQTQGQKLAQTISHQQLLQATLVELPITQLVDRINTEMNDNPALEVDASYDTPDTPDYPDYSDDPELSDDYAVSTEREERQSALDEALAGIGRDDEDLPVYHGGSNVAEDREEMVYGQSESFYDQLMEQVGETELTDRQRDIMEYLIGSLDDDGLLRKPSDVISDELAIYHNIDASHGEIEHVLKVLQDFDPAGIGARSLQECLLIQISRRDDSKVKALMQTVIADYFEAFTKKHWDKIQAALSLTDIQAAALFKELRKLNPRPGASMGETVGRSIQQITPDFIIDT
jgi:RNA polymerase sigma-54 factor